MHKWKSILYILLLVEHELTISELHKKKRSKKRILVSY